MKPNAGIDPFIKYVSPLNSNAKPARRNMSRKLILKEFGDRYYELVALIARYDPELLYSFSGSPMEYDLEVDTIIVQLETCKTVEEVNALMKKEFYKWLGIGWQKMIPQVYRKLSEDIFSWMNGKMNGKLYRKFIEEAENKLRTNDPVEVEKACELYELSWFLNSNEHTRQKIRKLRESSGTEPKLNGLGYNKSSVFMNQC